MILPVLLPSRRMKLRLCWTRRCEFARTMLPDMEREKNQETLLFASGIPYKAAVPGELESYPCITKRTGRFAGTLPARQLDACIQVPSIPVKSKKGASHEEAGCEEGAGSQSGPQSPAGHSHRSHKSRDQGYRGCDERHSGRRICALPQDQELPLAYERTALSRLSSPAG